MGKAYIISDLAIYALVGVSVGQNKCRHLCYGREMCLNLGNVYNSMLWSGLVLMGKTTVGQTMIEKKM